ncbi:MULTISPECIES: Cna B-type domain-containing protein [Clostridium]|nr:MULTISPECIES: Cna B-type domain-containing protein [Clostridium]MDB2086785.1 Cna B-type domain-containing protein [Clostridium paraputrificum]MDU4143886.1 Cna B-type domain-containing protein [Clostridium sp.]MDU6521136.1 Cna B-type domain-containing protein [Clostridium sp.]
MKKQNSIYIKLIVAAFMFLTIFALPVQAAKNGSITIIDKTYEGKLLENINVKLYKVADFTDNSRSEIVMKDAFKDFELDIDKLVSSDALEESARLCESFIREHSIKPLATTITDENGKAVFSDISDGIYLVMQSQVNSDEYTVTSVPFYVQVPFVDKNGNVNYQVTTYPKNEVVYPEDMDELSVIKIWKDNNNKDKMRPDYIEVGLYGNGQLKETVVLNNLNNWSYTWSDLSKDVVWNVEEIKVPDNYRMTSERNQNHITITNEFDSDGDSYEIADTGDKMRMGFYVMLFAVSGGLILICVKYFRKRN